MQLVIAATQFEMDAFYAVDSDFHSSEVEHLVAGVGPVESGVCATQFLAAHHMKIDSVVNFGIGGAYCSVRREPLGLLDICVADTEILGDFGICYGYKTSPFDGDEFPVRSRFEIDERLLKRAQEALRGHHIIFHTGTFVTVNGSSGSKKRGDFLSDTYGAICENMEGAALARACAAFAIPFVEIRAISNLVEDRPGPAWKTAKACDRAARAAALIVRTFQDSL